MFRNETVGNSTFLVYDTEEERVDELGLGMLTNNAIDGLLKFSCVRKDEKVILNYDVTTMIPLRQYFENYLHMEQVIHIFRSIADGIVSAEEYMLDTGKLMLDREHIYIEVNSGNCRLLYLPVTGMERERNLVEVFKRLLLEIRYDAQDDNAYMTEIINYLNGNQKPDCRKFGQWLTELLVKKERPETSVRREMRPGADYAVRQQEPAAGRLSDAARADKSGETEISPPGISQAGMSERIGNGGTGQKGQEEKKKGFFPVFGGKGKEEKKEDKKTEKKLEKKQEKEEKKQEKLREKQEKREAKKNGRKKEDSKPVGVNPYFAIPGQGKQEGPDMGMAVPKAAQSGSGAGMAVPGAAQSGSGAGMAVPGAAQSGSGAGMAVPGAARSGSDAAQRGPAGAGRREQRYEAEQRYASGETGGAGLDFGNTVIMGGQEDSSTVILSSQMQIAYGIPYLKRMKNGQKVYIDKPLIKIGREGKYVDFYIGDNPSVSRSHADIIRENDVYYIRDNNSSNHTYVESEMLTGGQKVKLGHGTKIRIADEEFVFYMY